MREEMKWLYILALKCNERLGNWICPSGTNHTYVYGIRIDYNQLYHFIVDNGIDFDPHGGTVR